MIFERTLTPITETSRLPGFELTYLCSGQSFKALICARNSQAAAAEGLIELASQCPDFEPDNARLVRVIQTH